MTSRAIHSRHESGVTLVELMVASVLALLILSLVVQLFFPAMRAWSDGQKRSEVGQSVLMTSTWIGDDVVRSSPGSVSLTPEGTLVMKCALGQTTDHSNPFSQLVAYWRDQGNLYRSAQTLSDPETLPPTTLTALRTVTDKRRVASGVTKFEISLNPEEPWVVGLLLEVEKEGRKGSIATSYSSIYAPADREKLARSTPNPTTP